jgi:cytochrome b561
VARDRYTATAITLHWVIALGILVQLGLGLVMVHYPLTVGEQFKLYQLHKSIGITVLFAVFLRLFWRLSHRPPELPEAMPALERQAASATHVILYCFMFALPFTGWAVVSASPFDIPTVLFGLIPWPDLPVLSTLADKHAAEAVLSYIHSRLAFVLIGLLALHILAALRHHFLLHDNILRRMLPRR